MTLRKYFQKIRFKTRVTHENEKVRVYIVLLEKIDLID